MSTLAEVRQDFIRLTNRYDLLTVAGISANVDNGANAFLNAGLRYLDSKVRHRKGIKKFIGSLAAGDFTFTVPDYIEINQLRMVTATDEIDLTKKELSLRDFRNTYSRPYSEWTNGQPTAWALNSDLLVGIMEHGVPENASAAPLLGQDEVREIYTSEEILRNPSFADGVTNAEEGAKFAGSVQKHRINDAEWWDRERTLPNNRITYDADNGTMVVNGAFTLGDEILQQSIDDMEMYPTPGVFTVTIVISGYTSGVISIDFGDGSLSTINANGTWTSELLNTTFVDKPWFRVDSETTATVDLTIDSISLKRVDVQGIEAYTVAKPFNDERNLSGIIFFPPTDKTRTFEFYARFYTIPMSLDTDRNYWTDSYPILLAQAGAYQLEKGNQSTARMRYWLEAMEPEISGIEADTIEDEMNAMENSYERTR